MRQNEGDKFLKSLVDNAETVAVVSCESGGAQILSSFIKDYGEKNKFKYILEGPAENIFRTKLGSLNNEKLEVLEEFIPEKTLMITGTSWIPELERKALSLARERNIYAVSVLDHWTNYRERFIPNKLWGKIPDNWTESLPDTVFVCDNYAYDIAVSSGFPGKCLKLINNYYLRNIKEKITSGKKSKPDSEKCHLLYISEPVRDDLEKTYGDPLYWGYDEFELAEMLCRFSNKYGTERLSVRFRLHPNESADKYDEYILESPAIHRSNNTDLLEDLIWSDAVLGGESMALVIALQTGKPVYSCLPEQSKKKCCLPHKEIKHINNLHIIFEDFTKKQHKRES